MRKRIRLVIADDEQQFITNLAMALQQEPDIEVVGTASDGSGLIDLCSETLPDIAVVGLHLPIVDGVRVTQSLLKLNAQMGVLIVSDLDADDYVLQAIKMGAKGFLRKSDPLETVIQVIKHISEGDVYLPSDLALLMLNEFDQLL